MALEYPDTGETWEEPSGTLPHMTTHRQPKSEEHCAEPKQDAGLSLGKNTSKNAVQQRSELSAESKEKEAGSAADRIQLQNLVSLPAHPENLREDLYYVWHSILCYTLGSSNSL